MKLGVIVDGISRDLSYSLGVMAEYGLEYAELQYVWDKEVGDLNRTERRKVRNLLQGHGIRASCLSRHIFNRLSRDSRPGDAMHTAEMDALKRVIEMAHELGGPLVRVLSPRKETILWGSHGAEKWNVSAGAWETVAPLLMPAVELARSAGMLLVVETGNGTMVNSCYTARLLIDDLGARDVLRVLWDPANACWCHERAWPDGYAELRGGYLGHIHIKDVLVDTPRSTLEVRAMGEGQLRDQFGPIGTALREDAYDGVISYESVYHRGDGDFEAGFRQSVGRFREWFH